MKEAFRVLSLIAAVGCILPAFPTSAEAAYTCRTGLPFQLCEWAKKCDANGHHVWERQFAAWACFDQVGKMKRKDCKAKATAAKVDFHHFTDGTCYLIYSKHD